VPPSSGLRIFPDQAYTAYHTRRWMPCDFAPEDRATFALSLTAPAGWQTVASGEPLAVEQVAPGRERHRFVLGTPTSSYILGFAAGSFWRATRRVGDVELVLLARAETPRAAEVLLAEQEKMLRFFERASGLPYPGGARYTLVLAEGDVAQEVTGYSVVSEEYARTLLEDPQEDWFAAHELAHAWWGNWLTCAGWGEFWLNEAFATFMTAAYKEERWGRAAYDREVALAEKRYEKLRAAGKDRPLELAPGATDADVAGSISYSKGALLLFTLRARLGDAVFWPGVARYSRAGRAARTRDLEAAFAADGVHELFAAWAYGASAGEQ
jgi:aminopeptidase N